MANKVPERSLFGNMPHEVYEYFRNLGVNIDEKEDPPPDLTSGLVAALSDTVKRLENERETSELLAARIEHINRELIERENNDAPNFNFLLSQGSVSNMNVIASGSNDLAPNTTATISMSTATGGAFSTIDVTKHVMIQSCASGMVSRYYDSTSFYAACSFDGSATFNSSQVMFKTNDINLDLVFAGSVRNRDCTINWQLVRID